MISILYVPPTDRPDVLAPSVGGGTVPMMYRERLCGHDGHRKWQREERSSRDCYMCGAADAALLLSLDGVPDAIGMGRAAEILADLDAGGHVDGVRLKAGVVTGTWCLFGGDYGRDGRFVTYSHEPGWVPAIPALRGVTDPAVARAIILAARIGGSVVVAS